MFILTSIATAVCFDLSSWTPQQWYFEEGRRRGRFLPAGMRSRPKRAARFHVSRCPESRPHVHAPDYLVGRLSDLKGTAKKVIALGGTLHDAYAAGAKSGTFVV